MRPTVPRIAALIGADTVVAEYWDRHRRGALFRTFEERKIKEVAWSSLMEKSDEWLRHEDFPSRMQFLRGGRAVLLVEVEMWNLVGGPAPYHDSVTLSFFSLVPLHEALCRIFVEEAARLGVSVHESLLAEQAAQGNSGNALRLSSGLKARRP